jgi:Ca2+-binding RTX toxin-like protein
MLSSVTFDDGSGALAVNLDGSDSASATVANDTVQVSINGTPTGDTPFTAEVSSITVTGGDGGHTIDLSGLQPGAFNYLLISTLITTGSGDDVITGSGMTDNIQSGGGNDVVNGGGGDDIINGEPEVVIPIEPIPDTPPVEEPDTPTEPVPDAPTGEEPDTPMEPVPDPLIEPGGSEVISSGGSGTGDPMPADWTTIGNGFPTTKPAVNKIRLIIGTRDNLHSFVIAQTTNDQFFYFRAGKTNGTLDAETGIYGLSTDTVEPFHNRTKYRVVGQVTDNMLPLLTQAVNQIDTLGLTYGTLIDNCHAASTAFLRSAGFTDNEIPGSPYPQGDTGATAGWKTLPAGFTIP